MWVALGFAAAAGAHAVHADSWTSFPAFLDHWEAGYTFAETVEAANRALGSVDTDRLVSPMFPEADSQKVIVGAGTFDVSMPGR